MSASPPIPPDIARITAPLLLGYLWNWALYGVLVVQIYVYSYNFPGDRKLLKLFVYAIFLLETLQTSLSGADLYYWFASGYGNLKHLANPYASSFDIPVIGVVVSLAVQFFFVYRIWVLGKKKCLWLCLIICLCSITDATAAFAGGIYTFVHSMFARGNILQILALIWVIANMMADILIAGAMLYHLAQRRRDTVGFFNDRALVKIVRLIIETNVMTTSVGIITFFMIVLFPHEIYYICPAAVFGKLYSNTLLVTLNNRISIRDSNEATAADEIKFQTMATVASSNIA
ncbi:hypothetical protein BGW80DRAFT_735284 [Lactifluus volemus]|nr:hypothetical protein BGW80DRAFT_735284 [Lactifluus volemus]